MYASLSGQLDAVALMQVGVWACGALWVFARLYPELLRRGTIPPLGPVQVIGLLFIGSLSLSLPRSPGVMLTGYTLGQFAVMISFAWIFVHRYGPSIYLRHLYIAVIGFVLMVYAAAVMSPELVMVNDGRLRGDLFVSPGGLAVIGLVLCLSNAPPLKPAMFWATLALCGLLLAGAQTRTCYVAALAYLAVGFVGGKGLPVRKLVPLLGAILLGLLLFDRYYATSDYIVRYRETLEKMSDRGPLWEHLTNEVMRQAPMTGLGYFAASRILAPEHNYNLGDAHSAFYEVLVGGGLLAASLYLVMCTLMLWISARLLWSARGQPDAVAVVGLLVVTLIVGYTSSSGLHAGPMGFTFWSVTALLPAIWRQHGSRAVVSGDQLPVRMAALRGRRGIDVARA